MARPLIGKVAYGVLFVGVLPALLVAWARATEPLVRAPGLASVRVGALIVAAGAALVVGGWIALWRQGGGLPMNAFPPPRFVSGGVFALVRHPIYTGFAVVCFGAAVTTGSASMLWLIAPTMTLGCVALVAGYEGIDLRRRFGDLVARRPWLALPPSEPSSPTQSERAAAWVLTVPTWIVLYELLAGVVPPDAIDSHLGFEARWPVVEETEIVYASAYVLAGLAPLVARRRSDLRELVVRALLSMALVFPLYLALPLVSPPRPFTPHGPLGALLAQERALDAATCAFPSFHVVWALIATDTWASRTPRWRPAWRVLAVAIAVSCVTTGMHALLDVVAGLVAFTLVARRQAVWNALRRAAEKIANSWREARIGPLRIINHGGWAALGTSGGVLALGTMLGEAHLPSIGLCAAGAIVGSALWAQTVEGSPALSRPYGFYGGLLGIVAAGIAAPLLGTPTWLLLGANTVVGPWVQATGRLRCLVQGCCHGHEAPASVGIRYTHPRSRVVRLSTLGGVPVHPTPLYSILWNVVTAVVVVRLWSLHASTHLVAGVYLILNGLGRFAEEAYRGEPQTPVYARLRLYQWVAMGSVLSGALVTALGRGDPAPPLAPNTTTLLVALGVGVVTWIALGVDFPESKARFSRLA